MRTGFNWRVPAMATAIAMLLTGWLSAQSVEELGKQNSQSTFARPDIVEIPTLLPASDPSPDPAIRNLSQIVANVANEAAEARVPRISSVSEAVLSTNPVGGEDQSERAASVDPSEADGVLSNIGLETWVQPAKIESSFKTVALLSVVSLAPAILLMTTSFVRISVVLGLLRQAIGTQMLPSNQVVTSLAMFLSLLVMMPVWTKVYESAIVPYTSQEYPMTAEQAWNVGVKPVREFMVGQIELTGNSDEVLMFYDHLPDLGEPPETYDEVPLRVLLPAFMLSELKTAFLIGFQIYLPFLIVDLVVSSVTVSMGMMMLPPALVSLPLKLLLFVMVDGWQLVVGMLLQSFAGYG